MQPGEQGHSALLSLATKLAVANSRELYKNDLTVEEYKTFLGLRIQMVVSVIKPQYREYWESNGKNFLSETPGFWKVMSRDKFVFVWSFLHVMDENDEAVDKRDSCDG
ncbi:PiggyBac transposable element-derived protein 4-like [Plakobranchus ocellatus]|uniref:PiggyBac transposable element-derived protein 4-like n=1 Tax=Plakobranchus ocellatus TaxID=259542 RepID=A0AAV4ADL9_9GAST|nr:PiggyBac transposable element-derived protein 4-like [Plakobranchus ocellatus]